MYCTSKSDCTSAPWFLIVKVITSLAKPKPVSGAVISLAPTSLSNKWVTPFVKVLLGINSSPDRSVLASIE